MQELTVYQNSYSKTKKVFEKEFIFIFHDQTVEMKNIKKAFRQ